MTTEDLIREALLKQADLAPPPYAMLAALHKPRRRNWTPLVIAIAATASVLAAIALTTRPIDSAEPATSSTVDAPPDRSAGLVGAVPLRFAPRWLPDGFVEGRRTLGQGGYTRTWVDPADPGRFLRLAVHPRGSEYWTVENALYEGAEDHVHLGVKGVGAYTAGLRPAEASLLWPGDGGERLRVEVVGVSDAPAVAERFAESLESDGGAVHAPVLTLAPEHAERRAPGDSSNSWTGTSPADWAVEARLHQGTRTIVVRVSPSAPDTTGGRPTRARGVEATLVPARQVGADWTDVMIVVPVGNRFLTVAGMSILLGGGPERSASDITEEELVDIATSTKVADDPDVSWFGAR